MTLSIILPVLDEAANIRAALEALAPLRANGAELIVVDGGSRDGTSDIARALADVVIAAPRGRGAQMNAGAAIARGEVLLFLHADTRLPRDADRLVLDGLAWSKAKWGHFAVRIEGHRLLAVVAAAMNWRARLSAIATGDRAIFVRRETFARIGGFPDIALMEDIALSRKLKRISPPLALHARVTTSGRRWAKYGLVRTILLMARLRLAFFFGAKPAALARRYGYAPREN